MFDEEPYITKLLEVIICKNPISGHVWQEHGRSYGYQVNGGGWMPTRHKSLPAAEKELQLRKQILQERALRGE